MAEPRSGGPTAAPPGPLARIHVHEAAASPIDPEADDPGQPAQRAVLVHQALGRELRDRAGRRERPLARVGLLDPDEVPQAEELLPEAVEGQRRDLLPQHAVPEPRTAVAVRLTHLLVDDRGLRHDADGPAALQPQAVLHVVAPDEELG